MFPPVMSHFTPPLQPPEFWFSYPLHPCSLYPPGEGHMVLLWFPLYFSWSPILYTNVLFYLPPPLSPHPPTISPIYSGHVPPGTPPFYGINLLQIIPCWQLFHLQPHWFLHIILCTNFPPCPEPSHFPLPPTPLNLIFSWYIVPT